MQTEAIKPIQRTTKLPRIQALRGLAACAVVFHHYSRVVADSNGKPSWIVNSGMGHLGAAGVDIFFVLSGFIMMYTTTSYSGFADALTFLKRRAQRVYPLYWFWTTVGIALWLSHLAPKSHAYSAKSIVKSYLLLPEFNGVNFYPFLGQGWTLSFEMMFYFVFALGILIGVRLHWRICFVACAFVLLEGLGRFAAIDKGIAYLWTNPIAFEFLFGMLAGQILLKRLDCGARVLPRLLPAGLLLMGIALYFATLKMPYFTIGSLFEWGIPSFLILVGCLLLENQERFVSKPLVYLGDASYSIYLTHVFFCSLYGLACKHLLALRNTDPDVTIVVGSVLTIVITSATYRLIEVPILAAFSGKRKGASFASPTQLVTSDRNHSVSNSLLALNEMQRSGIPTTNVRVAQGRDLKKETF
jgi:exopolysaccharide production protein ExoZ